MIRKAIIVVLALGAVSVTVLGMVSYGTPLRIEEFWLNERDVLLFRCEAGFANLTWLRAEEGVRSLHIVRHNNNTVVPVVHQSRTVLLILDRIKPRYIPSIRWQTKLPTQPPSRRTQIQVWVWMAVVALAAYPSIVYIRGPLRRWRRRRKGLRIKCGYNLTGNTSGVCPECGTGIPS